MAKQEECSKCKRAKQGGYAGEIKCSFYGRKPLFDDSPCSNFLNVNIKCPECGQEVPPSEKVCPNCGCPMKEESPQKSNITQPDNASQNTTNISNTTKKSNKIPLYTLLIILGLGVLIGLPVYFLSNGGLIQKDARYTIRIDDIFRYNGGAVTEMDVTVYECNESGATVYENNITFKADGSRDFVAQNGTKLIKVHVTIHAITPDIYAPYKKQSSWVPMAYALNPDENTVVTIDRQTDLSNVQP